jgi:hypothetical protein
MRLKSLFLPAIAFLVVLIVPIFEGGAGVTTPPPSPRTGLPISSDLHHIQISSCTWFQRDVWVPCTQYPGCITWALCRYTRQRSLPQRVRLFARTADGRPSGGTLDGYGRSLSLMPRAVQKFGDSLFSDAWQGRTL